MLSYLLACPWRLPLRENWLTLQSWEQWRGWGGAGGVTCIDVYKPPGWNWTIKGLYYLLWFSLILGWAHGTHWDAQTSGYFFLQSLTSTPTQCTQVSLSLCPWGHVWYSAPFWPDHMILQVLVLPHFFCGLPRNTEKISLHTCVFLRQQETHMSMKFHSSSKNTTAIWLSWCQDGRNWWRCFLSQIQRAWRELGLLHLQIMNV